MSDLKMIARLNEVTPGQRKLVKIGGQEIALFNIEGTLYAINNNCPHSTGPLIKGRLFGTIVTCPWHGAQFDITTGKCCNGPATSDVVAYPLHLNGDDIFIEIS